MSIELKSAKRQARYDRKLEREAKERKEQQEANKTLLARLAERISKKVKKVKSKIYKNPKTPVRNPKIAAHVNAMHGEYNRKKKTFTAVHKPEADPLSISTYKREHQCTRKEARAAIQKIRSENVPS